MTEPACSKTNAAVWLRAVFLLPMVILAIALIAGHNGYTATPFDAVSSGQSPWKMIALMLINFVGIAVYTSLLLLLYVAFIANGSDIFSKPFRVQIALLVMALLSGYALLWYSDGKVRSEITATTLFVEKINNGKWHANSCGRGSSVCIDIEGSLGVARMKSYFGNPDAVREKLRQLETTMNSGATLVVEWGRTPSGWNAVRSATSSQERFYNAWL